MMQMVLKNVIYLVKEKLKRFYSDLPEHAAAAMMSSIYGTFTGTRNASQKLLQLIWLSSSMGKLGEVEHKLPNLANLYPILFVIETKFTCDILFLNLSGFMVQREPHQGCFCYPICM